MRHCCNKRLNFELQQLTASTFGGPLAAGVAQTLSLDKLDTRQ